MALEEWKDFVGNSATFFTILQFLMGSQVSLNKMCMYMQDYFLLFHFCLVVEIVEISQYGETIYSQRHNTVIQ